MIGERNKIVLLILFIMSLIILIPILILIVWTFTERWSWPSLIPQVFSLRASKDIIGRTSQFIPIVYSSVFISLVVAGLSVIIGTMTARAFVLYEFKGKKILYFLSMIPFVIPTTIFALGLQIVFIKSGFSNTMFGVIIAHLVYSLPYAIILLIDGVKAVGKSLEEQARVLGATPMKAFRKVSLPLLVPVMLSAFSMSYIVSFSQYFLTLIIGGGKVKTFAIVMFPYLQGGTRNIASVYSLVFLIITIIVFILSKLIADKYSKNYSINYY
ncbi:ABC transporter permease [Miniphocaeibacter massiliensis]|uniref:ABC transporter permease n=1 Tax=Miniphocaeibacter massiliensis TaxID=2041841 RepID=UPI000C07D436|nr:ABC transporter permease subunit [Miniphocaeibacter massiliensis]